MINFDYITGGNKIENNPKWPYIPNHSHKMFIIGGTGLGKTNLLLNPIKLQRDIDKSYSHAKDSYKANYLLLSNKRKSVGLKHYNDSKAFIKYWNLM